jgi:hypothetical protein
MRQFTANELVALARCFDLPVLYFLLPPTDGADGLAAPDAPAKGWPWEYLLLLVWGHRNNFPIVAERAAPWAHASTVVTVPVDDVLDGTPDTGLLAQLTRDRERYTPEDMLAVAFNGLARRRMRGAVPPGDDVATVAASFAGTRRRARRLRHLPPRAVPRPRRHPRGRRRRPASRATHRPSRRRRAEQGGTKRWLVHVVARSALSIVCRADDGASE